MKTCQYCRKEKTDQFIRTAQGIRWKCQPCKEGRYKYVNKGKGNA